VFHGDTLFAESEVVMKRESESRDNVGIVTTELSILNQDDELVMSLERSNSILKREHAQPSAAQPPGGPRESELSPRTSIDPRGTSSQ
jgi:hypothetical protein